MSKHFDMVVFLADKIEPYRNHDMRALDDNPDTLAEKDLLHGATYRMLLHSKRVFAQNAQTGLSTRIQTKPLQWMRDRIHTKGENSVHDIQGNRNQSR